MEDKEWLILNYKLPKEPSRVRVSIWRKLKKLGSVNIGQSMWVLPFSEEFVRNFGEISKEIMLNSGEAYVMRAFFINDLTMDEITQIFNKARDTEYTEVLEKCSDFFKEIEKETKRENFTYAELEENEYEYNKLTVWFENIAERDFFEAALKSVAAKEINKCKKELDIFSKKIYEINAEK